MVVSKGAASKSRQVMPVFRHNCLGLLWKASLSLQKRLLPMTLLYEPVISAGIPVGMFTL